MLDKLNRLKTKFEYNITRKYGKKYNNQLFSIFVLKPKNYSGPTKIGVVVSNKIHKKATKRNRVKRVFREVVRKNLDKLPKQNLWIVIHPRSSSLEKGYEEVSTEFNKTLQKVSFPS